MLFLRYESFSAYIRLYPMTTLLLIANLVMFIVLSLDGGSENFDTLLKYGATANYPPYNESAWYPLRYIGSMFLHFGFQHLLYNGFSLFVFAPPLERLIGKWKFISFYMICGVIASIISDQMTTGLSVGASGAIYAVFGAYLYLALRRSQVMDEASRKTIWIVVLVGGVYSLIVPNVNYTAHGAGLIAGLVLMRAFVRGIKK